MEKEKSCNTEESDYPCGLPGWSCSHQCSITEKAGSHSE